MSKLLYRDLTGLIIAAYYEVYNRLSRTYPEHIYENAMIREIKRFGIDCERQKEYKIFYKRQLVGVQQLDIFVAQKVVVELKVLLYLIRLHEAQTMSYMKVSGKQVGLLFNFGGVKPEFKRLFFTPKASTPLGISPPHQWPDLLFPEISYQVIGGLFEVHNELGPGFIHRIYANASYREMQMRGFEVKPLKEMALFYRGKPLAKVKFGHMLIEGKIMLFPVAIRDITRIEQENLRRWMRFQGVPLGILANFHADKLDLRFMKTHG